MMLFVHLEHWTTRVIESEAIISELDEVPLPPSAGQEIALEIIASLGMNDDISQSILNDYCHGRFADGELTSAAKLVLKNRLDYSLSEFERSKYSLLAWVFLKCEPLDGYSAEYVYAWVDDLGVDVTLVNLAFRKQMRGGGAPKPPTL